MEGKHWYTSKTLWIAIITALIGVLVALGVKIPLPENEVILIALGVIGFIIRLITKTPVVWTDGGTNGPK